MTRWQRGLRKHVVARPRHLLELHDGVSHERRCPLDTTPLQRALAGFTEERCRGSQSFDSDRDIKQNQGSVIVSVVLPAAQL